MWIDSFKVISNNSVPPNPLHITNFLTVTFLPLLPFCFLPFLPNRSPRQNTRCDTECLWSVVFSRDNHCHRVFLLAICPDGWPLCRPAFISVSLTMAEWENEGRESACPSSASSSLAVTQCTCPDYDTVWQDIYKLVCSSWQWVWIQSGIFGLIGWTRNRRNTLVYFYSSLYPPIYH